VSEIPDFNFDFDAVEGQPFEEATVNLFRQLEKHYNANIKPAPIIFGGRSFKAPVYILEEAKSEPKPVIPGELMRVQGDYQIKSGKSLGLRNGSVLTGLSDKNVEIFDFLKNYHEGDTVVEGESGKYDLGKAK